MKIRPQVYAVESATATVGLATLSRLHVTACGSHVACALTLIHGEATKGSVAAR